MNRNYSILIFPWRGKELRRLVVSKKLLGCLLVGVVVLVGVSGWLVGDYIGFQLRQDGIKKLEAEVQAHRTRLFLLQERADTIQTLLASWKGLREKIDASLPKKHKTSSNGTSSNGHHPIEELETSLASLREELERLIDSVPSRWPTSGRVSSGVGMRASPWTGKREFHAGLDIPNPIGTPVYAPADGTVKKIVVSREGGRTVVVDHGRGVTTAYAHLSKTLVQKEDRIRKGQKIAQVGNTGKSTSPHLHYEVRVHGIPIDPRRKLLGQKHPSS